MINAPSLMAKRVSIVIYVSHPLVLLFLCHCVLAVLEVNTRTPVEV